jgi:molybdopterin biosynthesis enzyme
MSQGNCFILLPHDGGPVAPGDMVEVQPFDTLRW